MSFALRVAIVGTNDPRNYSGGRYHALMMAYAVAAGGGVCHVVTDHMPGFSADLEPLAPGAVTFHATADFVEGLPPGPFDWVVIVPTGVFLPNFYENALDFAARSGARVALLNFESANWFNALSPEPRDPRLWDGWRRCLARGGLVLSSAREADRHARAFYRAEAGAQLRFEVWSPPINSLAARACDGLPKDGSLLAFVRPQDRHKGSSDLRAIDPALLRGRVLRLVAGRDVPPDFRAGLEAHLARAPGSSLDLLTRISDAEKFRLVTAAQAVLFPSRFEGYGYPPVEAAYAGTESVCFDLPVLRETVGGVAHVAPAGNMAAFGEALGRALRTGERRATLRAAVERVAEFDRAAGLLVDILLRSADAVAPLPDRSHRVALGPFARTAPRTPAAGRAPPVLPLPDMIRSAVAASSGDILLSGTFMVPGLPDGIRASEPGRRGLPVTWTVQPGPDGWFRIDVHVVAPAGIVGRRVTVLALAGDTPVGDPLEVQVDRVEASSDALPVRFGLSGDRTADGRRQVRGWILARRPVTEVRLGDGTQWWAARVTDERADVLSKFPSYPRARCQFVLDLPEGARLTPATARLIAVSDGQAIDSLAGWPPAPLSMFAAEAPGRSPPPPAEVAQGPDPAAHGAALPDALHPLDVEDARWVRGIGVAPAPGRLGAALVARPPSPGALRAGMVVRGASGTARVIRSITALEAGLDLGLDGPLSPDLDGFPGTLALSAAPRPSGEASFVLNRWTDDRWWNGVWNLPDDKHRACFFLPTAEAEALGIGAGTCLRFAASGLRTVLAARRHGKDTRFALDGRIRPLGDGAPHPVRIESAAIADPDARPLALLAGAGAWRTGINETEAATGPPGTRVRLAAGAALSRGQPLRFASGRVARVLWLTAVPRGTEAAVDTVLDPQADGLPGSAWAVDEAALPEVSGTPWLFPDPGYRVNDPLHLQLALQASRDGRVLPPPPGPPPAGRPRVLFLTPVPPAPANQGNRVVTRNLIRHLVDLGFDVDVVLQGWIDARDAAATFGAHVRLLALPFPDWFECEPVRLRRAVAEAASAMKARPQDRALAESLERGSNDYHPYFVVRDAVVEAARMLVSTYDYRAIAVNYTHMLRVTHELARHVALPPVCVFTHDALSRLPTHFAGQALDTLYRACRPEVERAVLDAAPAVVVAISGNEADYFRALGVENRIVLTEIDAADEARPYRVPEASFEARRLIFHGSANPMNIAGLDWFIDSCWAAILAAEPQARLAVCGRIGEKWTARLPNVDIVGEIGRDAMFAQCQQSSIAINPCVAGTGLKIKTVEAACIGLPSVCLPLAVDGLEAAADAFAIVAETGEAFADACIALLRDRDRWSRLRDGGLAIASERFAGQAVYAALDEAMGWSGVASRPPALRAAADQVAVVEEPSAEWARGLAAWRAGQASGRAAVERVLAEHPGDPGMASVAARLALDLQEPWFAVRHGAVVVGQRPLEPDGYLLVGKGLYAMGQVSASVECFVQGVLVAPGHADMLAALDRALSDLGRTEEAAQWRELSPAPDLDRRRGPDLLRRRPAAALTQA